MNYRLTFLIVLAVLTFFMGPAFAGEYFERDGAAIGGYDPVAYFTEQKPVRGSTQLRSNFQGSTFLFASAGCLCC